MAEHNHYIDNDHLEAVVKEHQGQPTEQTQAELARMFTLLAENLVAYTNKKYGKQPHWMDQEDQIQDSVLTCLRRVNNYKQDRSKAFNFFTGVSLNSFRQTYRNDNRYYSRKVTLKEGNEE